MRRQRQLATPGTRTTRGSLYGGPAPIPVYNHQKIPLPPFPILPSNFGFTPYQRQRVVQAPRPVVAPTPQTPPQLVGTRSTTTVRLNMGMTSPLPL